ncbi:hypothetical protein DPMN_010040 [Dreissena polymorpha]|uniref:Uncharacterized protein n=1 Tax=Dreissena polymorpha TaxID=45954 RepID=A0A9D4N2E1_DREPO|nr:hypothetical protein DPMN_010040 [Dreissena polymorpha]
MNSVARALICVTFTVLAAQIQGLPSRQRAVNRGSSGSGIWNSVLARALLLRQLSNVITRSQAASNTRQHRSEFEDSRENERDDDSRDDVFDDDRRVVNRNSWGNARDDDDSRDNDYRQPRVERMRYTVESLRGAVEDSDESDDRDNSRNNVNTSNDFWSSYVRW